MNAKTVGLCVLATSAVLGCCVACGGRANAAEDAKSTPAIAGAPASRQPMRELPPPLSATGGDSKTTPKEKDADLAARLQSVLRNTCKRSEQIGVLRAARESGRKEFTPTLFDIAKTCSRDPDRERVAMESLYAAAMLDDLHDSLLALARDYKANPVLAAFALMILGQNPDDKATQAVAEGIPKDIDDNLLRSAVANVRRVRHFADKVASLQDVGAKVAYVLPWLNVSSYEDYRFKTEPYNAWIKRELLLLSERHPKEVARALMDYRRVNDDGDHPVQIGHMNEQYRRLVAAGLSKAARQEYEELTTKNASPPSQRHK